jgi:hypothetical protein
MPLQSRINQYIGVNAHLQSYFQNRGGWSSFHNNYIRDLAVAIDRQLPSGYLVDVEQSLQIREYHPDTGEKLRRPQPDITVYDVDPSQQREPLKPEGVTTATMVRPVAETLDLNEDQYYPAVVIYKQDTTDDFGEAVTRIELLSPSNKQGTGEVQYREKRIATLKSGVKLVEIDLLHQTPSPLIGIPLYPEHDRSYPYNITVSNPQPSLEEGLAETYAFHVEEPLPIVAIPLVDAQKITVDFGKVYNITFSSLGAYSYRVDYEQYPNAFETYSQVDQAKIKARMDVVQATDNLDAGPFPLPPHVAPS